VHTERGDIKARAVVLAMGVKCRRLDVPALEDLLGRGVNYASAVSAARELQGARAIVVGGGNSAGQSALYLARFADEVTIMVRRDGLTATMSA
jgi:thioredoxin reductase (NADPH)